MELSLTRQEKHDILFIASATGTVRYDSHSKLFICLQEKVHDSGVTVYMHPRGTTNKVANDLRVAMTDMRRKLPWLYPQQKYLRRSGE